MYAAKIGKQILFLLLAVACGARCALAQHLTAFAPSGWSDKIVVATSPGTHTDSSPLAPGDTLYVAWAIINDGTAATTARFYTDLYVDGVPRTTWYIDPPLAPRLFSYVQDYSIGSLPPGTHTLKIKIDTTNTVAENSVDKEYTKTITVSGGTGCAPSASILCLNAGRFKAEVSWRTAQGASGVGTAVPLTGDTGYFSFFSSSNVELILKVLDARAVNQHFWVFSGALSDVEYTITVTDSNSGAVKTYFNPQGRLASFADTSAFPATDARRDASTAALPAAESSPPGTGAEHGLRPMIGALRPGPAAGCTPNDNTLCLNGGRFAVTAVWRDFQGHIGTATAVPLTADTGYFWFFAPSNVELVVKVLDGRGLNDNFWLFYGALSTVDYTIVMRDTQTGAARVYHNGAGSLASIADTRALTGRETAADGAAALSGALAPYSQQLEQELANVSSSVGPVALALDSALASVQSCLAASLAGSATCPGIDPNSGTLIQTPVTARSAQLLSAFLAVDPGLARLSSSVARAADTSSSAQCSLPAELYYLNSHACSGLDAAKWFLVELDFPVQATCLDLAVVAPELLPVCGTYMLLTLELDVYQALACNFAATDLLELAIAPSSIPLDLNSSADFAIIGTLGAKGALADSAGAIAKQAVGSFLKRMAGVRGIDPQQLERLTSPLIGLVLELLKSSGNLHLTATPTRCTAELSPLLAKATLDGSGLALTASRTVTSGATPTVGKLTPHAAPGDGAWSDGGLTTVTPATVTVAGASCVYSLSSTSQHFSASGGSDSVEVTAPDGCGWTATSGVIWITVKTGGSSSGGGPIAYVVDSNDGAGPRTGKLTITGNASVVTFTVTQDAATGPPPQDNVTPRGAYIGKAGGCPGGTVTGTFQVTAPSDVSWTAGADQSTFDGVTVDISPGSGSGPGLLTVTITVPPQKPSSSYSNCTLTYALGTFDNFAVTFSDGDYIGFTAYYDFIGVT
jgi:hypothetical protein